MSKVYLKPIKPIVPSYAVVKNDDWRARANAKPLTITRK